VSLLTSERKGTHPSGNKTTAFRPSTPPHASHPSLLFNHLSAPESALPLLPPTRRPSVFINSAAALNDSSSEVFNQKSTVPASRERTGGIKSYPIPSTT
jgi:hypothetical protein